MYQQRKTCIYSIIVMTGYTCVKLGGEPTIPTTREGLTAADLRRGSRISAERKAAFTATVRDERRNHGLGQ